MALSEWFDKKRFGTALALAVLLGLWGALYGSKSFRDWTGRMLGQLAGVIGVTLFWLWDHVLWFVLTAVVAYITYVISWQKGKRHAEPKEAELTEEQLTVIKLLVKQDGRPLRIDEIQLAAGWTYLATVHVVDGLRELDFLLRRTNPMPNRPDRFVLDRKGIDLAARLGYLKDGK
jgi:hypothetical protein